MGCHFLLQCMKVKSESEIAQLYLTLSDSMDCSPPGSSVHGIFQARVLERGAIAFSAGSPQTLLNHCSTLCPLSLDISDSSLKKRPYLSFWVRLVLFSTVFSRSIHVVTYFRISFFYSSITFYWCIYHVFLSIHPSMGRSCFYIMTITNNVARNLGVQMSFQYRDFNFLFIYSWLHWVFIAVCELFLVAKSRSYSSLQREGFSLRWPLVAEHRL